MNGPDGGGNTTASTMEILRDAIRIARFSHLENILMMSLKGCRARDKRSGYRKRVQVWMRMNMRIREEPRPLYMSFSAATFGL